MILTYFLAQVMGAFCVVIGLFILTRRKVFVQVVHDVENNQPLIFALGVVSLVLGLLFLFTPNFWPYGFLAFVVTLIGWIVLIRGLVVIFLPQRYLIAFIKWAHIEQLSWLYGLIVLVIGLYLCYGGFIAG